jgi:hypothetical protein
MSRPSTKRRGSVVRTPTPGSLQFNSQLGTWHENFHGFLPSLQRNGCIITVLEDERPPLWSSGQSSWLHNGDVLCFLWGTNWIYICYVEESRPPLWSSGECSWLHNGDVLCFLWGTNWIYISYVEESRPPLWSSGQSSWLQIRRPGFDSRHYLKKSSGSVTGSTQPREYNWGATWYKSSVSCLENREHGSRDPSRWPRGTLYPQKLAITLPTRGGRSVGIVR